jgi:hypothetical protein
MELAVVFDNAEVNALEQLSDIVIPVLIQEVDSLY